MSEDPFSCAAIEHGLNVLPLIGDLLVVVARVELEVPAPRVEVGGVGMVVLGLRGPVKVKDEFVG